MKKLIQKIRDFEIEIGEAVERGEIKTPCHLSLGQEPVAVGVCAALEKSDVVYGTHRSHALFLAKGGDINKLRDEIYGKETGCMNGRGGSMHLKAPEVGFILSSPIVGGSIPLAVGSALAFKMQKKDNVAVAFLGDGATNEGVFWESLNFASIHSLSVLFVVENNGFCVGVPYSEHSSGSIVCKANEFRVMIDTCLNDVDTIHRITKQMVDRCHQGYGPQLLEVKTVREGGHVGMTDERNMK